MHPGADRAAAGVHRPTVEADIVLFPTDGTQLFISGEEYQAPSFRYVNETVGADTAVGQPNADWNVIASTGGVVKWTRLDLGSYSGGSGGCNYWGLITPPST